MPLHDWDRVDAGVFHDFHLGWVCGLRRSANGDGAPPGYYSLSEEHRDRDVADVVARCRAPEPIVSFDPERDETRYYTARRRTVTFRDGHTHRAVALVETITPGDKANPEAWRAFVGKAKAALRQGVHLLILDVHRPTPHAPRGVDVSVGNEFAGESGGHAVAPSLVAYSAGPVKSADVRPLTIGRELPAMAIRLSPEIFFEVPVGAAYQAAFAGIARRNRAILEAPA